MDRIAMESQIRREFAASRKFTPLNQPKEEILHILIAQGEITDFLPPPTRGQRDTILQGFVSIILMLLAMLQKIVGLFITRSRI